MLLLGEAWGQSESELRRPFIGESGKELFRMIGEAAPEHSPALHAAAAEAHQWGLAWVRPREKWLEAEGVLMTNVLAFRPPANKMDEICCVKADLPAGYSLPYLSKGKYLKPEFLPELDRMWHEIEEAQPNLIVALGNTALWALTGQTNIGSVRGAITQVTHNGRSYKVLPTYHPAGVMRQWSWRPIVIGDLVKAFRQAEFPEVRRPARQIIIDPTIEEVEAWTAETLANPPPVLGCDTETEGGQIKMISFARSKSEALVIPFLDKKKQKWSFWPEAFLEERAWQAAASLLESPICKVFQNGLYDFQYLLPMHIRLVNCLEDSMLLHHSIFPEMRKGLGFLGASYADEPAWKLMRTAKPDTEKRDD